MLNVDQRTRFIFKSVFVILLCIPTVIICAATLMGFLARLWWGFSLFSHFRVQYALAASGLALIWLIIQNKKIALFTGCFAAINLALIIPLYFKPTMSSDNGQAIRVFFANVHTANPHHEIVRDLIIESDPGIIVLLEVNQNWLDDLDLMDSGFTYSVTQPREDNFGIALFSRFSLSDSGIVELGRYQLPSVYAQMQSNDEVITIIATHPPPPSHRTGAEARNQQIAEVAQYVIGFDTEVILFGDLNLSSWSPYFTDLIMVTGLRDSRLGFGVQPTWPTGNMLLQIPLDHVLVSPKITVLERYTGPYIGSDHLPVILEISVPGNDA